MTLLLISPDYASHLLPLATLGTAWRDRGERVVVATGAATAAIVESFGFERVDLALGKGSNPGVIRATDQPPGEDAALTGFFEATRRGMVETLAYQAEARLSDLMWEPVRVAREVQRVVDEVAPDAVVVDHLAFSARLALVAGQVPHADVVLGHPTALPVGNEVYGFPPAWPTAFDPGSAELAALRELCVRVSDSFTAEWNAALAQLAPGRPHSRDAFSEHGDLLLLNYPEQLCSPARSALLGPHEFLGSMVRTEPDDPRVSAWLEESDTPVVYVSFGSFLSVRSDVLARVATALATLPVRVALALGSADPADIGTVPPEWLVRETLPQVAILARSHAAVTHGGNNSVTEAMTFGVPLLVLPFSTDQFAGAAAIEDAGVGIALAPNEATVAELRSALEQLLVSQNRATLEEMRRHLQAHPGATRAHDAITARLG